MLYNLLFFMEFIFIIDEEMFDGWHPQLIKVIVLLVLCYKKPV